jgi:hypothetical protein
MRMWYRYLPQGRIFGIDINPGTFLDNDRVTTAVVDQGDPEQLVAFVAQAGVEQFDVIIDDGSHRALHQQLSLSVLFPFVAPGGLYFIEDLGTNQVAEGHAPPGATPEGADGRLVMDTRRVLRAFGDTGRFPEPHALLDPARLAPMIESVSFYCPAVRVGGDFGLLARLTGRQRLAARFTSAQEELCVLRKVPGPT